MMIMNLKKLQMLCNDCRKKEIDPTFWERVKIWIIYHLFGETISDIKSDSFTQGFSEGYTTGFSSCSNSITEYKHIVSEELRGEWSTKDWEHKENAPIHQSKVDEYGKIKRKNQKRSS